MNDTTTTTTTRPAGFGRVRQWATALAVAGTAAVISAVGLAPAEARSTVDSAHMKVAAHSAKVLDIPGASHQAGTQLIQWATHGRNNQRFRELTFGNPPTGPNAIRLVILVSAETGQVVDVSGGTAEGAAVVQKPWSGSSSQVWWAAPFGNTGFTLYVNMGSGKVMTVAGASRADGAPIVQGTWQGGVNQLWQTMDFIT
ncbi:MAG: RICIN domain-containing protein [Actinomycetota bacterium]|nr:RICIN domain-containing protein [Actinomycetota bacterium]